MRAKKHHTNTNGSVPAARADEVVIELNTDDGGRIPTEVAGNYELVSSPTAAAQSSPRSQSVVLDAPFENVMLNWNADLVDTFHQDDEFFGSLGISNEHEQQYHNQHHHQQRDIYSSASNTPHHRSGSVTAFSPASSSRSIFNIPGLDPEPCETAQPHLINEASNSSVQSSAAGITNPGLRAATIAAAAPTDYMTHSRCVIICSNLISSLEKYLLDDLKVLDFILGTVKGVLVQLNPFIELHNARQDVKCLILFFIICHQIVELLEIGCANFLDEGSLDDGMCKGDLTTGSPPITSSSIAGLGFDVFSSPKNQRRWQSQIILDEMQPFARILHVLDGFVTAEDGQVQKQGTHDLQHNYYGNLIDRLNLLVEKLKR